MDQQELKPRKTARRMKISVVLLTMVIAGAALGLVRPSIVHYSRGSTTERPGGDVEVVNKGFAAGFNALRVDLTLARRVSIEDGITAAENGPAVEGGWRWVKTPGASATQLPGEVWVRRGRNLAGFGFTNETPKGDEGIRRLSVSLPTWFLALVAVVPAAQYLRAKRKANLARVQWH
jgi:hypothetical protein